MDVILVSMTMIWMETVRSVQTLFVIIVGHFQQVVISVYLIQMVLHVHVLVDFSHLQLKQVFVRHAILLV